MPWKTFPQCPLWLWVFLVLHADHNANVVPLALGDVACGAHGVCTCSGRQNDDGFYDDGYYASVLVKCCFDSNPTTVDLSATGIEDFDSEDVEQIFYACKAAQSIDLAYNSLEAVPGKLFTSVKHLSDVDLSYNIIQNIPGILFSKNEEMTSVSLEDNKIENVPESLFANNRKLSQVKLNGNTITAVPQNLFANNQNLTSIDLENNKLFEVPENLFAHNGQLIEVDLSDNQITNVPDKLFANNKELTTIDFSENQINCLSENFINNLSCPSKDQTLDITLCDAKFSNPGCLDCNYCSNIGPKDYRDFSSGCISAQQFCIANGTAPSPTAIPSRTRIPPPRWTPSSTSSTPAPSFPDRASSPPPPSLPSASPASGGSHGGHTSVYIMVGAIGGTVVGLTMLGIAICVIWRRRKFQYLAGYAYAPYHALAVPEQMVN